MDLGAQASLEHKIVILEVYIINIKELNRTMESDCVEILTKIEYANKKKLSLKMKIEFLRQTLERMVCLISYLD